MARKWIKLYVEETFSGSTFIELTYKERYVWWGLLLMAGRSPEDGRVMKRWDTGYTPQQLAYELDCPASIVRSALAKMINRRKDEDVPKIKILDNGIIEICNWHKYQSEYQRQKPYRHSNESNNESYNNNSNHISNQSNTIDIDIDKDIENTNNIGVKKDNWKRNYAIGMEAERKHNSVKEKPNNISTGIPEDIKSVITKTLNPINNIKI